MRKGFSLNAVQEYNRRVILSVIHRKGSCSRKEISEVTHLDQATVTRAVMPLIEQKILSEVGLMKTARGRRSISLSFDTSTFRIVAVRLQRFDFSVAVYDLTGRQVAITECPIPKEQPPEQTFAAIIRDVDAQIEDVGTQVIGIGIALPGPFLEDNECIVLITDTVDWQHFNLVQALRDYYVDIPLYANHDAKVAALSLWRETVQEYALRVLLYISVGQGVGSGLVIDGEVFHGGSGTAGEIGHTSVNLEGVRCKCGNFGCLELYTSHHALQQYIADRIEEYPQTKLTARSEFPAILQAFHDNDPLAVEAVNCVAIYLAQGIVNAINLLNPEVIVLGDEFAALGDKFLDRIRGELQSRLLPAIEKRARIWLDQSEKDRMLDGSFLYVMENVLLSSQSEAAGILTI